MIGFIMKKASDARSREPPLLEIVLEGTIVLLLFTLILKLMEIAQ